MQERVEDGSGDRDGEAMIEGRIGLERFFLDLRSWIEQPWSIKNRHNLLNFLLLSKSQKS